MRDAVVMSWENFTGLAGVTLGWVLSSYTQSSQRKRAAIDARLQGDKARVLGLISQARRLIGTIEAIAATQELADQGVEVVLPSKGDLNIDYNSQLQACEHLVDEVDLLGPANVVKLARRLVDVGDEVVTANRQQLSRSLDGSAYTAAMRGHVNTMQGALDEMVVVARAELQGTSTKRSLLRP